MRQNYSGNKRRREEAKRKKQEEKRLKRLNRNAEVPAEQIPPVVPETPPQFPDEHGA